MVFHKRWVLAVFVGIDAYKMDFIKSLVVAITMEVKYGLHTVTVFHLHSTKEKFRNKFYASWKMHYCLF
jgi:hypothetical protein